MSGERLRYAQRTFQLIGTQYLEVLLAQGAGNAKVDQLQNIVALFPDEVARVDVFVDDVLPVDLLQSVRHFDRQL